MSGKVNPILHWAPRVLGFLFLLFSGMFAFDVFDKGFSLMALLGFLLHAPYPVLILISLLIAWKKEKIGGIVFIVLGSLIAMEFSSFLPDLSGIIFIYLIFIGPFMLIGVLFLLEGILKGKSRNV